MSTRPEPSVALRMMDIGDLDEVVRIEQAAHVHPWSAELLRRELDHDWSRILLAVENVALDGRVETERILGYIVFWLVHDELHVLNVATDPACRRRGAGRRLMLEAERICQGCGAVLSTLEVRVSNAPAIALYQGLGYRQVGRRPRYYQENGEDALVMLKELASP